MIVAVVFQIHVGTPQHIAKLFIKEVPKETTAQELKKLLTEAGYSFGEFGTPWANHYLEFGLAKANSQVKGAWKSGEVQTINFKSLSIDWETIDNEN